MLSMTDSRLRMIRALNVIMELGPGDPNNDIDEVSIPNASKFAYKHLSRLSENSRALERILSNNMKYATPGSCQSGHTAFWVNYYKFSVLYILLKS